MQCPVCNTENPVAARFCEECGARLARRCPQCGHEVGAAAKFCLSCGGKLPDTAPASGPPAEMIVPERYTPPHLAAKIRAARPALVGERKQVTILFADVVGSTELIQDRDPEEAQRLLDGMVRWMMDAVHRYEGTVSRLMGDGLMAMFGAPVAHEDHAVRACYSALALQELVRQHADEMRRTQGFTPGVRVGMSSGEVVVRTISDDLHMDYTAMGETVHLAARMEQLAGPGTIVLTAEMLALVEGYVQVRSLGPMPIKGKVDPVEVYELLGAGAARSRLQVAAARGLTRFVGRQAEMEALHAALSRAEDRSGQVAALVGEPGVGKSRLVWELTHSHRTAGWLVLESGSVSYGRATPWLPVVDLLRAYCRVESRDDERAIREKVTGKLLTLDRALEPSLPALLALLDVAAEDPSTSPYKAGISFDSQARSGPAPTSGQAAWEALDPAQRRGQTLDAVRLLLLRESQRQPLLLVFEDLHWIDAETQVLLDGLVDSLSTARILLLVNYRPEYRHDWGNRSQYTQLRIDPLGAENADELLAGLLGDDRSLEPLKALLQSRTEGNPLFIEECVRSLGESGDLVGERGAYRLPVPLATIRVPATVQAVLAARFDRLPAEEKRLLQIAAVIGKDVPDVLLRAIADRDEDDLRHGIAALQAAELLYEASLFPDLEYTFKHALIHEVAYGSLLQERRRTLHTRVMAAIERQHRERLTEHVERLAHHAVRGEVWEKVVTYAQQAGARYLERSAHREALAAFEQALAALQHLPESQATLEKAIDLRFDLRNALLPLGRLDECVTYLHEAEHVATELGDQRRLGWASCYLTRHLWPRPGFAQAIVVGQRALAIAEQLGDVDLQVATSFFLGQACHFFGEHRRAVEILEAGVARLEGTPIGERFGLQGPASVLMRTWLVSALAELGSFDAALAHAETELRLAGSLRNPIASIHANQTLGLLLLIRGEPRAAILALERALTMSQEADTPHYDGFNAAVTCYAHALVGDVDEAARLGDIAERRAELTGTRGGRSYIWIAQARLMLGHGDEALQAATWAHEHAVMIVERGAQAWALWLLGEIAARREPPEVEQAEARYREALELAEELGMRPLQAHCRLGLGRLYRRVGRIEEASEALGTSVSMLRGMGMAFWLPEAEAELAASTR